MSTIPFTTALGNYLAINLPEEAQRFFITKVSFLNRFIPVLKYMDIHLGRPGEYELPPGDWSIVGAVKDITEDRAKEIVGDHNGLFEYPDYEANELCNCDTAICSFKTLLKANGIDQDKHYLILKDGTI